MRRVLKRLAEVALHVSGAAALARHAMSDRTLILAYHNIVPDGASVSGDRSLHLPQRAFARQLDALVGTHDVVPLGTVLEGPTGRRPRPRAVITFDDATVGALTAGVEELVRLDLPATVFVAPAFVGGRTFWWDALTPVDGAGPGDAVRDHALTSLRGDDRLVREWAYGAGHTVRDVPGHQACASEAQLHAAARRGIEFGSHTWGHPNLTTLPPAELKRELELPLAWLKERFPTTIPWLAYPYGLSNAAVADAARHAGYIGAVRVEGGWLPSAGDTVHPHDLPRLNIPSGLSAGGFRLRTSGLLRR